MTGSLARKRRSQVLRSDQAVPARWPAPGMALLTLVGLGIAGYMSYTALGETALVCGGLGDCETVHSSAYARIGGVPVAVLGLGSYLAIAVLLGVRRLGRGHAQYLALLGVLAMAMAGTVFSAYLTFVELFVIYAVCPWCVASAITLAALLGLSLYETYGQASRS